MKTIDDLVAAVAEESTIVDSVISLVGELKSRLDEELSDLSIPPDVQAKIDAVFSGVTADSARITEAVVANTPAEDVPVDEPATEVVIEEDPGNEEIPA